VHVGCLVGYIAPFAPRNFWQQLTLPSKLLTTPHYDSIIMSALEEEHTFHIEKVSPLWLITALCVVPFGIYYLLNLLSPVMHRLTALRISEVRYMRLLQTMMLMVVQIYIYPIKSLRAVKVTEAVATEYGFQHDSKYVHYRCFDALR